MTRRSRTRLPGLLARQFRADLGPLLAMAAIVLVVASLAATTPSAVRAVTTAEVDYQVDSMPPARRDLLSTAPGSPLLTKGVNPFDGFEQALAGITEEAPDPLRRAIGDADFVITTDKLETARLDVDWNDPLTPITVNVAPRLADHIRITEGAPPRPFTRMPPHDLDTAAPGFEAGPDDAIDILLSAETAERGDWEVGESRMLESGYLVRLSGVFEAIDPGDGFWAIAPSALQPGVSHTSFSGSYTLILQGGAFIDPGSWPVLAAAGGLTPTTTVGIPFRTGGRLTAEQDEAVLPQLRQFLSLAHSVSNVAGPGTISAMSFDSQAEQALTTALQRAATAIVVLAMVASGPIGVAVAALWLLSRLVVLRRRDALALAAARGASGWQLRATQALECLLLTLPAAAAGAAAAFLALPASWTPVSLVFAAVVAIVPPALLALAAGPRGLRAARGDLDPRARGRYRWVLEVLVLALTGLALFLLLQRGLTTSASTVGVDPLLAATPLLLALAAGLLVLRLYPLPLIGFARSVKPRRGLVAFLGANRAIRDPAAGLAPVLAMVVGLSVAVFSGVMLGTVSNGVDTAAASSVGADLRVESPPLEPEQVEELAGIPGVEDAVGLFRYTRLLNLSVGENLSVPTIVADTAALARVQEGIPGTARFTVDMAQTVDGRIPVLLSPDLAARYTIDEDSAFDQDDIVSGGDAGTSPSLSGVDDWVLVDSAHAEAFGITRFAPRLTLLKLAPGADIAAVKAAVRDVAGADATATTPDDAARMLRASPVSGGLELALLALIVVVALLCAAVVVLALMISGPARERLLALLRTVGLTRSQARGITAWEIAPSALVAIVTGCLLGTGLPLLVLAGVDLRPFTGGAVQPAVSLDPVLLSLVVGGFALLVAVATAVAMAAARRVNLTRTLRTSEEG